MIRPRFLMPLLTVLLVCLISPYLMALLPAADSASRFFPAKDLMPLGAYYYPERGPQEQWDRDFAKIEEMGFEFVHIGEFA